MKNDNNSNPKPTTPSTPTPQTPPPPRPTPPPDRHIKEGEIPKKIKIIEDKIIANKCNGKN